MKVIMQTSMAGPSVRRLAGEEVDIAEPEAKRLIAKGFAVPVRKPKTERATAKKKTEKAVTRSRKTAKP